GNHGRHRRGNFPRKPRRQLAVEKISPEMPVHVEIRTRMTRLELSLSHPHHCRPRALGFAQRGTIGARTLDELLHLYPYGSAANMHEEVRTLVVSSIGSGKARH